jgi:hypothetical protein
VRSSHARGGVGQCGTLELPLLGNGDVVPHGWERLLWLDPQHLVIRGVFADALHQHAERRLQLVRTRNLYHALCPRQVSSPTPTP